MSLLKSLTTSSDIGGEEKDSLGGGTRILDSGIYRFKIALAYLQKSSGGALGLFLHLKDEENDRELRQTMYLTGGDAKGNKNYYLDKDQNKQYLPGFNMGNSLALLTTGKEISDLDTDTKTIPLYNFESRAEVPTKVEVVTDLMGKEIYAAVFKQLVDKNAKNDATGKYEPTGEKREENEIDKFFCARDDFDKLTSAEIKAKRGGQEIGEDQMFYKAWADKNNGKVRDKSSKTGATAGAPAGVGGAKAAPAAGKPSNSLFG